MKFTEATASSPAKFKRVGVVGGGQLASMMGDAARALGIELVVQTPDAADPAVSVAAGAVLAAVDDVLATAHLADGCDVITFENEFVDLDGLRILEHQGVLFRPSLSSLSPLLDKYVQRCYLQGLGLPTPKFWAWDCSQDLHLDFPFVVKVRRHGYDGQGTFIVKDRESFESICDKVKGQSLLVEEFVPFDRELAVIAARSATGEMAIYPIVETQQQNQVCHNSGHFTINACKTSQFEQHLRAVCQLPLGNCDLKCSSAVMVNLLGYESAESDYLAKRKQLAQISGAFVHWYGKKVSRPGRKLGHVTVLFDAGLGENEGKSASAIAQTIESIWYAT
ncbi:MAG: ATP-grasp domain-containing protein [Oscillatoriales cyanobacterium]|nr:MAG: ATP-grasp domain-containing protein [Oscillatoriales cyanobacterium]